MNNCCNKECGINLYKHNIYCCNCGYKATNPIIYNNGVLILRRTTHIYCCKCMISLEDYGDKYCRNCGISVLNKRIELNSFSPIVKTKKYKNNFYFKELKILII